MKCWSALIFIGVVVKVKIQECINSKMLALESANLETVVKSIKLENINFEWAVMAKMPKSINIERFARFIQRA